MVADAKGRHGDHALAQDCGARRPHPRRVPAGDGAARINCACTRARRSGAGSSAIVSMACPADRCCCMPRGWSSRARRSRRSTSALRCRTISGIGAMRPEDVVIPEDALSESFLAATGPGGQNVNKVATAVQLRVDLFRLGLHPDAYRAAEDHRRQPRDRRGRAAHHRAQVPHAGGEPAGRAAAAGGNDCCCPYRPGEAQADAAEPGGQGPTGRQEEATERGEADARKDSVRLKIQLVAPAFIDAFKHAEKEGYDAVVPSRHT